MATTALDSNAKKVAAGYITEKIMEKLQYADCCQLLTMSSLQDLLQEYDNL